MGKKGIEGFGWCLRLDFEELGVRMEHYLCHATHTSLLAPEPCDGEHFRNWSKLATPSPDRYVGTSSRRSLVASRVVQRIDSSSSEVEARLEVLNRRLPSREVSIQRQNRMVD